MKVETDYVHYHLQDAYLLANQEPILGHYIKEIGFIKRSRIPDLFCALVHTIIAQLISSEAARKIWQRMQEQFLITPEYLSTLSIEEIKQIGLTYNKAKAIHNLSLKIINHEFNLKLIHTLSDKQALDYLTQLDGIGVWSAKMILLHVLERPNIISYEDKAILNAMKKIYHLEKITKKEFEQLILTYHPYESIASIYLWKLSQKKTLKLELKFFFLIIMSQFLRVF